MKRSKFLVIVFAILAVMVGGLALYANQQKTLGEIMNADKFGEWIYIACTAKENDEWDFRSGHVDQQEDIQKIAEILSDTKVSFMKFEYYTKADIDSGDVWYEVDDLTQGIWIQVMSDGEVHTGFPIRSIYQIDAVYSISEKEWMECTTALEGILQKYEREK